MAGGGFPGGRICPICGKRFTNLIAYARHLKAHKN